ncbi:MAG: ABC transporter substrate-binding protein [Desulfobacteraceae bacterium]|nr:ABC transporter substrate-binding protein [Desulfobacteraceae bacterium]
MRKMLALVVALALVFGSNAGALAADKQKLVVYTSMKESLIGKLRDAFVQKNPDIDFDYYSAGAGKLMAKLAAERESGTVVVDVLWTSEIPDFYQLKDQGMLEPYVSEESKNILSPVKDPEGYFTPARLGTLGITYNTKAIKEAPKSWQDLLDPRFKGAFGIANPALSGTAYVSIAMLVNTFGWDYITKLKANGAKMGQGSGQVVDDTASGDLKACIGVDYITTEKIQKGATLGLAFPQEMLVIPSPVAIIKTSKHVPAAKKFIDFLLSKEGQVIIASSGTLPIRQDVNPPDGFGLVHPDEAVKRAMKADYQQMIKEKEATIQKFSEIMRGN